LIFLLHRICYDDNDKIIQETKEPLDLIYQKFVIIATELEGHSIYKYHRAISPGIQEFIEAVSFREYLLNKCLISRKKN